MNHVILCDVRPELCDEWKRAFEGTPVEVVRGEILSLEGRVKAFVSPANSFGFMDGGIDLVYLRRWPEVQKNVRSYIGSYWRGEMPVGAAGDVKINDSHRLIVAPTMRSPEDVSNSINAFLAFRAILFKAHELHTTVPVACPGLATGCGRMPAKRAALQMRAAYDAWTTQKLPETTSEAKGWTRFLRSL